MESSEEQDDVEILTKEGSREVSRNNISGAIVKYQEAYEIARTSGKHEILVSCACNLGAALLSRGDAVQAIEHLQHASKTLDAEKLPKTESLRGDILFNLGLAYSMKRDFQGAVRYFGNAADVFMVCSEWKGLADSCQQLGEQKVKLSQPGKAAQYFCEAGKCYLKSERVYLAARMVLRRAQSLHDGGKSEKSFHVLKHLDKLIAKIQNSNTDSGKLPKLFCDTGSLFFQLRSPETASGWLHQALNLLRSSQDSRRGNENLEARILLILGETFSALGVFTKAVTISKEASALYGKLENKKARGQCFYQLAEAYRHLGDHHNAEKYYHIAYQTLEDADQHSFLWHVLEGLADLNYQRRQLNTSITYYKETIDHLSQTGAAPSVQHHVVSKLATALEVQRVGVVKAESYKNRVPVLVQPEKDLMGPMVRLDGPSSPDIPFIQSPVFAPLTSTRLSLYSSLEHSPDNKFKLQVPRKKKKKGSKNHGRRRSGSFDEPVSIGVGEYDTETDISLVGRILEGKAKKQRTRSEPPNPAGLMSEEAAKLAKLRKSAPRRLLSHIKGLEIEQDGSAAPISSVDDSTQMDLSSDTKHRKVKGFNMASFSDSDEVTTRGRSASQTVLTDEGSSFSSSSSDDESDEGDSSSFTKVTSEEDATGTSSEDDSDSDSYSDSEELKHLYTSSRSGLGNTYEHPSSNDPMYATIKSRKLLSGQVDDKLYESLDSSAPAAKLTSTLPKRTAPSAPPEPPRGPRPSQMGNHSNDNTYDELGPATTSWGGPNYPESSALNSMSRGQREIGLYQVARLEQERKTIDSGGSFSSATSDAKVPKSRACIVM